MSTCDERTSDAPTAKVDDKPPTDDTSGDRPETLTDGGRTRAGAGEPGPPDTGPEDGPADGATGDEPNGDGSSADTPDIYSHLRQAIEALQAIDAAL